MLTRYKPSSHGSETTNDQVEPRLILGGTGIRSLTETRIRILTETRIRILT